MKGTAPYICDGCGKSRASDLNHWMKIYLLDRDGTNAPDGIMFIRWEVTHVSQPFKRDVLPEHEADACGQECASKLFARYLATGSLEEAKVIAHAAK